MCKITEIERSAGRVQVRDHGFPLTVVKVGGSLLEGERDLQQVAVALARRRQRGEALLVVASALQGVTDLLELAALQTLDPRLVTKSGVALERLRVRHEAIARSFADEKVLFQVRSQLDEIASNLDLIRGSGELPDSLYSRILSAGERLSVLLLAAAIRSAGACARSMTADEMGLRAQGSPRAGACNLSASRKSFRRLRPTLGEELVVLTGFYGIDAEGKTVLFGRGGSDDTACAVAAGLDAVRLELWKNVPGCMSADPRVVPNAQLIRELSFGEVSKLGVYGSRILHRGCLALLDGRDIEIVLCGIDGSGGTRLVGRRQPGWARVAALTASPGRSELKLPWKPGDNGLARRILMRLDDDGVRVSAMSQSAEALRFTVEGPREDLERVREAVSSLCGHRLAARRIQPLVAAVGDGIGTDRDLTNRFTACLAGSAVRSDLVVRLSGHTGVSCGVHQDDLGRALHNLHEHFFSEQETA